MNDSATAQREREYFKNGPEMHNTVVAVNERLGFNGTLSYGK